MSTEVDWVLQTIWEQWPGTFPSDLARVDRDESRILEGDIRKREGKLEANNFVGATHADTNTEVSGSSYDHTIETIVGVRIEGMHVDKFGHVDPSGANGISWEELVQNIRRGLLAKRSYPSVGADHRNYHSLLITNEADQSDDYRDYFRFDFDVVLDGFETLP